MTDNTQPQPEALRLAHIFDHPIPPDWPDMVAAAAELRRQHAHIAELESELEAMDAGGVQALNAAPAEQQAQPDECFPGEPKVAVPQGLISAACFAIRKKRDGGKVLEQLRRYSVGDRSQPLAPQQAAPKAAPGDALDEALRERDDAEDFIDATLDEVLGHERPEWSSSYGRADALNDVQERMTALHKPAVDKAWDRFQSTKAAPGEQDDHQILAITTAYEQGVGKGHQAYNSGKEIANPYSPAYRCDLAWQYGYKEGKEQAAPKTAPGVGNSGFDHQTAADFLNGKTVSDESVRKFVAASRWAHDERAALSATLLAMHGVLTSREAEIALLKKALLEAEAAPQQEPAAWRLTNTAYRKPKYEYFEHKSHAEVRQEQFNQSVDDGGLHNLTPLYTAPQPAPAPLSRNQIREVFMAHGFTIKEGQTDLKQYVYDAAHALLELVAAPQQEAQEPAFWMNEKGHTWSHSDWKQFPKHRAKYPIPLYPHFPAPQPAPACHHRPPCDECAALAAQKGK